MFEGSQVACRLLFYSSLCFPAIMCLLCDSMNRQGVRIYNGMCSGLGICSQESQFCETMLGPTANKTSTVLCYTFHRSTCRLGAVVRNVSSVAL